MTHPDERQAEIARVQAEFVRILTVLDAELAVVATEGTTDGWDPSLLETVRSDPGARERFAQIIQRFTLEAEAKRERQARGVHEASDLEGRAMAAIRQGEDAIAYNLLRTLTERRGDLEAGAEALTALDALVAAGRRLLDDAAPRSDMNARGGP